MLVVLNQLSAIYDGDRYIGCWVWSCAEKCESGNVRSILRRVARFIFLGQPGCGKQALMRFDDVLLRKKKASVLRNLKR